MGRGSVRLFLGIDLPEPVRQAIVSFRKAQQGLPVRWLAPVGWHVTLVFIGKTRQTLLPDMQKLIEQTAAHHSSFSLSFHRYQWMPPTKPRMLWARFHTHPHFSLLAQELHQQITRYLAHHQHSTPPALHHPIVPHVTLARTRNALPRPLPLGEAPAPPSLTVAGFHLFASHLSPQGATYEKLASFMLSHHLPH